MFKELFGLFAITTNASLIFPKEKYVLVSPSITDSARFGSHAMLPPRAEDYPYAALPPMAKDISSSEFFPSFSSSYPINSPAILPPRIDNYVNYDEIYSKDLEWASSSDESSIESTEYFPPLELKGSSEWSLELSAD